MPINSDKYPATDDNINKSPESAGVYALYEGELLIYYGRAQGGSVTIRSRLQSHKRGDEGRCTQAMTHYAREVCSNPVTREVELLNEYKAIYGRLPRCNERVG